jgi:hypothetical protein
MLVELLRGCDVRMSQDELRIPRRHAQILEQRGFGVSGLMHSDAPQTRLLADLVEGPDEVLRVDWCANGAEEHQFWICGGLASYGSGIELVIGN